MSATKKEIVYIDIEDEITSVIDKVVSAKGKVIALVPPKRAQMLQSTVNMKLLKRRSEAAGKQIVLVTSEHGLLPLAGLAGVHVAKNLQSKPYLPEKPLANPDADPPNEVEVHENEAPVGALSSASSTATPSLEEDFEPEPEPEMAPAVESPVKDKKKKQKSGHKETKIPNFNSFRSKLLLGLAAFVVLLGGWFVLYRVLPKATVQVKAETSRIDVAGEFTAITDISESDIEKKNLVAEEKQVQKAFNEVFTPSGEKNIGTKAAGTITIRNCDSSDGFTLPGGTRFTESSGKVFVSTVAVSVPKFSGLSSTCTLSGGSSGKEEVAVEAVEAGDTFNLSSRSYSVGGVSGKIDAVGSQMSGGTSKVVKVVTQADLDAVKQKILTQDSTAIKEEIKKEFTEGFTSVDSSFSSEPGAMSSEPALDQEASSGKASITVTYRMVGLKTSSLEDYIISITKEKFDQEEQELYDKGIDAASIKTDKQLNGVSFAMSIKTDAYVGPKIDEEALKLRIKGKRTGEASEIIKNTPGVRDVNVKLSPFYIRSLPNPGKISINFDVDEQN